MPTRVFNFKRGLTALLCASSLLAVPAVATAMSASSGLTEADLRVAVSSDMSGPPGTFLVSDWHQDAYGDTANVLTDLVSAVLWVRGDDPNTGFNDASAALVSGMPYFSPPKVTGSLAALIDTNGDTQDDFVIESQVLDGAFVSDVTPILRVENGSPTDTGNIAVWKYRGVYGYLVAFDWRSLGVTAMRVRMQLSDNSGSYDLAPNEYEGPLQLLPVAPSAPGGVAAEAGDGQATVAWAPPAMTGTHPITAYVATATPGGASCTTLMMSCVVGGLTNGQAYTFTVVARSAAGPSPVSVASAPVIPASPPPPPPAPVAPAAPSPPVSVVAVAGDRSASVSWTPPTQPGTHPITAYVATASPGGASCTTAATSCVVSGLFNGVTYSFTVVARSEAGTSAASAPSAQVTPRPFAIAKARARRSQSVLWVDVDPNKGRGYWSFRVEVLRGPDQWAPVKTYKTVGAKETRTVNLNKGTYRVVVLDKYGYQGTTSAAVTLRK